MGKVLLSKLKEKEKGESICVHQTKQKEKDFILYIKVCIPRFKKLCVKMKMERCSRKQTLAVNKNEDYIRFGWLA
jgi:hypothetical protein